VTVRLDIVARQLDEAELVLLVMIQANWKGRHAAVLPRLMAISPDLARAVAKAQTAFEALGKFRLGDMREPFLVAHAMHTNDAVLALIGQQVKDSRLRERAQAIFLSRRDAIWEGPGLVEETAKTILAEHRRLQRLRRRRLANAPSEQLLDDIKRALETALADIKRFELSPAHTKAVESYLRQISVAGDSIQVLLAHRLAPLIKTLGRLKAINRKWPDWLLASAAETRTADDFARHFQHERNYVKGLLGELWFEFAHHTDGVRELLFRRTIAHADRLSRGDLKFTADFHLGPLSDPDGRQIFDGIYFVRRDAETPGSVKEVHLDAVVEVKTGTRAEYVMQELKDQFRELGPQGKGLLVRTADEEYLRIMPLDIEDPVRVFVAPERPKDWILRDFLEPHGIQTVHVPTLPTGDEFALVADFFLLAILNRI
jgi:hypothetical protein